MTEKKRIEWIDIMKFICIFFVMLSHLGSNKIATILRAFYKPFFLNGFLFASGYTYISGRPFKEFLNRKMKQLLLPWFLYSNLNILLSAIITLNKKETSSLTLFARNLLQVRGWNDELWFVAALFIAYIPFYWLEKRCSEKKNNTFWVVIVLLLISKLYSLIPPYSFFPWNTNKLPWHIEYIPQALSFMYLGRLLSKTHSEDRYRKAAYLYPILWVLPILLNQSENKALGMVNELTGVMFLIWISKLIKPAKLMNFVGQNTLSYFGLHRKLVTVWEKVWQKIDETLFNIIYANELYSAIYSIIFSIFACVILIIPIRMINRYIPEMAGKQRRR